MKRALLCFLFGCAPAVQTPPVQDLARFEALPPATPGPHHVKLRVYATRVNGAMPYDESGVWNLDEAPQVLANLNSVSNETSIVFDLADVRALDVDDSLREVPSTGTASSQTMVTLSRYLPNDGISVVVMQLNATWVQGWGNIDQPLGTMPFILVSTRIARSKEAHWIVHELGHVLGFHDLTYYGSSTITNTPYTRCGLNIGSSTYPKDSAPVGARRNFMSYNTEERATFFSEGYESYRSIVDCWLRSSRL